MDTGTNEDRPSLLLLSARCFPVNSFIPECVYVCLFALGVGDADPVSLWWFTEHTQEDIGDLNVRGRFVSTRLT